MSAVKRDEATNFWKPSVAADLVIFGVSDSGIPHLLLIRRGKDPFKGYLAFPGGFLDEGDADMNACAHRELREETGLELDGDIELQQLPIRSALDRDPRQNRVISVPFLGIVEGLPEVKGADDAVTAEWVPLNSITAEQLAFDHWQTLQVALDVLS